MVEKHVCKTFVKVLFYVMAFLYITQAEAAGVTLPGVQIQIDAVAADQREIATAIKIMLVLTVLSLAPAILIMMTSFTRIIIVLSMLRHAFGMQQTPPNTVLISLGLLLTVFNMMPVFEAVKTDAFEPYVNNQLPAQQALDKAMRPLRDFMLRQTREKDLLLVVELSGKPQPKTAEEIDFLQLVTAFMLSELKTAFQIGFVIFLPFLLVDLVVASILMSMGMLMVPPMMISLPIKIMMFVLIDGWALVVQSLMSSFL